MQRGFTVRRWLTPEGIDPLNPAIHIGTESRIEMLTSMPQAEPTGGDTTESSETDQEQLA